jgi:hypothetical protein
MCQYLMANHSPIICSPGCLKKKKQTKDWLLGVFLLLKLGVTIVG